MNSPLCMWATVMIATMATPAAAITPPTLSLDGFSWVENLVFDGRGHLWASEATLGQLWRVQLASNGSAWTKTLVLDGFRHVDGLVVTPDGETLYAIAQTHNQSRTDDSAMVISVNTSAVGKYDVVVHTPDLPNGMKRNLVTGKLYLTVEGQEFLPTQGKVYEVDAEAGTVDVIMSDLFWSDGIAIDHPKQLLYVGELMTGHVYTYNMSSGHATSPPFFEDGLNASKLQWMDDFFVDTDCRSIVGAGYSEGVVFRFPTNVNSTNVTVLATGLKTPTAVLWGPQGDSHGFRSTSLYVTEGGGFTRSVTDRRIVEIPNMRTAKEAAAGIASRHNGTGACWTYIEGVG